ncbi:MAG: hypothetical protein IPK83_00975 [Planctomycetes bacterium]|nr:hypothetical protein [Planctomycetota bacterium]
MNAGEQFRYAIAWSTHTSGGTHENITNDVLTTDLDLYVYDCAGNLVAWSNSFNNPYEVVAFNSPKKQNYRVEIRVFGAFGAPFEYLGEAWNADDPICEEDNLDALEVSDGAEIDPDVNGIPNGGTKFAFFSIKGMSPTAGAPDPYPGMSTGPDPTGVTPDDILVSPPPFGGPFSHAIYARGTIDIGLLPGDDLDSLVLLDNNGPDGVLQPNLDIALFTLAPGSPSLAVGGFSAAMYL